MRGAGPANEASFIIAKTLVGFGRGLYQTAVQVCIQAVVGQDDVAVATGVFSASMNLGGAIGTSLSGAIWRSNLLTKFEKYLPSTSTSKAKFIFASVVVAQKLAIGTTERQAIDLAYRETQQLLAISATCALAPMVIIIWLVKNVVLVQTQGSSVPELAFNFTDLLRQDILVVVPNAWTAGQKAVETIRSPEKAM